MPQRKAAKKDLRKNLKRREKNLQIKQQIKSAIKKFKKSIESADTKTRAEALRQVYKILDKSVSKKILHANKAARKKSRLTKLLKSAK
ncbi:MAG: 30S ribosomal protein S20 [Candidatus Omnitrophota bacterium]|nr:MAG: 30S ribosomal protein S20 [Candidatus Omnitrophota bacterium]